MNLTVDAGVNMARLFVSYARLDKRAVDELVGHLGILGYDAWIDSSLRGGQDWWDVILSRIAECDAFIASISRVALNSQPCVRELDWAEALGKPVLPVAVERLPPALPSRLSRRQIVDYSQPGNQAALNLAAALVALPSSPPLPAPLPRAPEVPLSYLSGLVDRVSTSGPLPEDEQRHILHCLELALRSVDSDERQGGRDVLDIFRSRADLDLDTAMLATELADSAVDEPNAYAPNFASTLSEPEDEPERAQLRASDGAVIPVPADGLRIGRMPDNDLVVANPRASRHHAVVVATPDGFVLRDLGSANGTHVGETRVLESHLLHDGDEVRICDQAWTFERVDSC